MKQLYNTMAQQLAAGTPFALATILASQGSTPRTPGARMMVFADRIIRGTIGGGAVEAAVIEACGEMLARPRTTGALVKDFILDQDLKSGMDMVCGGQLRVWIEPFGPDTPAPVRDAYGAMAAYERTGTTAALLSELKPAPDGGFTVLKTLKKNPADLPDALGCSPEAGVPGGVACLARDTGFLVAECLFPVPVLYIFGGGHVGYALAEMAHLIDLPCVVVDDREAFANPDRFPHARAVHPVPGFKDCFSKLGVDQYSYIVIMTRGHLYDEIVLEQALGANSAYIGMIGSHKKRDTIYRNLRERGADPERLKTVYSPVGLSINSETPAEIAVSIIAQIISHKGGTSHLQRVD